MRVIIFILFDFSLSLQPFSFFVAIYRISVILSYWFVIVEVTNQRQIFAFSENISSLTISHPPFLLSSPLSHPLTLSLLLSFPPTYSPSYTFLTLSFSFPSPILLSLTIRARGQLYRGLFRVFMATSDMLIFPPLDRYHTHLHYPILCHLIIYYAFYRISSHVSSHLFWYSSTRYSAFYLF